MVPGAPWPIVGALAAGCGLGYAAARLRDLRRAWRGDPPGELVELQTEFVAHVSHELRTPLTSIRGYAKLLLDGDAGALSDTQREFLLIVDTNAERLGSLINDLLDVEKMESGRVQLGRTLCDLREVLGECVSSFEGPARSKGLSLALSGPEGAWLVEGDRGRLAQAFGNLVSNAIKYTSRGGVTLTVEKVDHSIRVNVADTGPGLSPEETLRLFRKFYRAPGALESGQGGTGLGLFIARGFVEAHGGTLKVASEPGQGSTFSVTLPRAPDSARQGAAHAAPAPVSGAVHGLRVLVVDPDLDLRLLIKRALERAGLRVDDAALGSEVPLRTGQEPYDLVLLDLSLTDRPIQELVREAARSGTRVLVMGDEEPQEGLLSEFEAMGASGFVPKYQGLDLIVDEVRCRLEKA